MKLSRKEWVEQDQYLDLFDANSQLSKTVIEKITDLKFELSPVVQDYEKYSKAVYQEFLKSEGLEEKDVQAMPPDEQKDHQYKFETYLAKHGGYDEFMKKEVEIKIKPIYKSDLKDCKNYKPSILFGMHGKVFFQEREKVKAKATSN